MSTATKSRELMQSVNKALGKDVLRVGSDPYFNVDYIPTGLLPFDILLQGGIAKGRFTILQGDWSTLKTYVGLHACAQVQKRGGIAAIADTEHAFDPQWARECGVDVDALILLQPSSGEEAIDAVEALIRSRTVDLVVFDSVAAATPEAELSKRLAGENIQPGRIAALMSAACRRLTIANEKTAVIWINQMRENIGITFGKTEKATGGRALPFYGSVIIEIRKVGKITRDDKMFTGEKWQGTKVQVGQKFKAELIKSKLNKPFREVWFDWSLTEGTMDVNGFLISQGVEHGLVSIKGNTWTYEGCKAVGRAKFFDRLSQDHGAMETLQRAVYAAHGLSQDGRRVKEAGAKRTTRPPATKRLRRR